MGFALGNRPVQLRRRWIFVPGIGAAHRGHAHADTGANLDTYTDGIFTGDTLLVPPHSAKGAHAPAVLREAGKPATVFAQQMSPGINLGNTLEAIADWMPRPATSSEENAWGNPNVNQAIMDGYKAAGFKSVRIPVSWSQYLDANGKIPDFWMNRVRQVVDYARNAGLYVIINIHWDGGWINPVPAQKDAVNAKLTSLWTQIANGFKGYDDHLLFAGTNEVAIDWR